MSGAVSFILSARRRVAVQRGLNAIRRASAYGVVAGLLTLVIPREFGWMMPGWAGGAVFGLVLLWAIARAMVRPPSPALVASLLDERLALADRLITAWDLTRQPAALSGSAFGLAALADADDCAAARRGDLRRVVPIRAHFTLIALILSAAAITLTARDWPTRMPKTAEPNPRSIAWRQALDEAQQALAAAPEAASPEASEAPTTEIAADDSAAREVLDALERQLAQTPSAREGEQAMLVAEAAKKLEEDAAAIEERHAELAKEIAQALAEAGRAESVDAPQASEPGEALRRALAQGDFARAREALDRMAEGESEQARESRAEELERIARALRPGEDGPESEQVDASPAASADPPETSEAPEGSRANESPAQEPPAAGSPEAERSVEDPSAERPPSENAETESAQAQEPRADDSAAQEPAGESAPGSSPQQARRDREQARRELARELERAAEDLRRSEGSRGLEREDAPRNTAVTEQAPQRGSEQSAGTPPERQPQSPPGSTSERGTEQGAESRSTDPSAPQSPSPGHDSSGALRKLAQEQNRAERTRRAAEALQRGGTPEGDASGSEVTTARRGDQDQTGEPFSAEMEQSAGSGNIPGSRGGAGGVPEEAAGDHSNPRASDDLVDLTRGDDELNGRTIAEWGDPRAPTQESSARGSAASQSTVERASRRAERALEQSNVPSRYHDFIRRYFDRRRKVPAEGGG